MTRLSLSAGCWSSVYLRMLVVQMSLLVCNVYWFSEYPQSPFYELCWPFWNLYPCRNKISWIWVITQILTEVLSKKNSSKGRRKFYLDFVWPPTFVDLVDLRGLALTWERAQSCTQVGASQSPPIYCCRTTLSSVSLCVHYCISGQHMKIRCMLELLPWKSELSDFFPPLLEQKWAAVSYRVYTRHVYVR